MPSVDLVSLDLYIYVVYASGEYLETGLLDTGDGSLLGLTTEDPTVKFELRETSLGSVCCCTSALNMVREEVSTEL